MIIDDLFSQYYARYERIYLENFAEKMLRYYDNNQYKLF